jgi:S-adenosylmethionine-diacylglycerol 3-amino-3-carboxypropyl transferase
MGRVFREVLRIDTRPIFEAHSLEEQAKLFKKHFKPLVFRAFVRIAASEFVFNRFLYKGHFSGRSETKTESRSPSTFIEEEFTRLFTKTLIRKNYFLQILFLGGILYEEGLPLEAREDVLMKIKESKTKVNYKRADLVGLIKENSYDFLSLSDTISYLNEEDARLLLQSLPGTTKSGARAVIRSFLKRPKMPDLTGWMKLEAEEKWAHALDTTGVYEFDIVEKF